MEIELDGVLYALRNDKTAVCVDARSPEEFKAGTLPGAKNIPLAEVKAAKDDGRLPQEGRGRGSPAPRSALTAPQPAHAGSPPT